jgi:hypothetical protein
LKYIPVFKRIPGLDNLLICPEMLEIKSEIKHEIVVSTRPMSTTLIFENVQTLLQK